jgi:chromosome partitioning protein
LTDHIAADLAQIGAPVATTRIGNRIALVRAMASGLGVGESESTSHAAAEIAALADEVRKS